jgi:insertion element IS1 protein InsB
VGKGNRDIYVKIRRVVERRLFVTIQIEFIEEAECDEMWSFVGSKAQQRWLWYTIDHATGKILAYVLGSRKDEAFIKLKALLEPFEITRFYTDDWGAYERHQGFFVE